MINFYQNIIERTYLIGLYIGIIIVFKDSLYRIGFFF